MRSPEIKTGLLRARGTLAVGVMLILGGFWFWSGDDDSVSDVTAEARAPAMGQRGAVPSTATKRQPQASTPFVRGSLNPDPGGLRSSARKAVPVTRGKELDTRFRPDDRASPYGGVGVTASPYPSADDIDFRPIPERRRPTYEELQAEESARQRPAVPMLPMPLLPGAQPGPLWRP